MTETLGSECLTGPLLRLTHNVAMLKMNRDDYRLAQSRRKRPPPILGNRRLALMCQRALTNAPWRTQAMLGALAP